MVVILLMKSVTPLLRTAISYQCLGHTQKGRWRAHPQLTPQGAVAQWLHGSLGWLVSTPWSYAWKKCVSEYSKDYPAPSGLPAKPRLVLDSLGDCKWSELIYVK